MTSNGVMALILRYFTKFGSFWGALRKVVEDVVVKSSRSLSKRVTNSHPHAKVMQ